MEKETMKALALVKGAMTNDVQIQIEAGKKAVLRFRPYIDAYRAANAEQRKSLLAAAEEIMAAVNDKVAAYRKSKHDPDYKHDGSGVRVSEFRAIMAFGAYDCAPAVLNGLRDTVLPFDGLLAAVRYCTMKQTNGPKREAWPTNRAAPSATQVQNAIKARREAKTGRGKPSNGRAVKRDASKAVKLAGKMVRGFGLWFNDHKAFKADAAKQVSVIMAALAEMQSIAQEAVKA